MRRGCSCSRVVRVSDRPSVEEVQRQIRRGNLWYNQAFSSTAGEKVLADLKQRFYDRPSNVPGDPFQTHVNEGAREVMLYILQRINKAEITDEGMDGEPV